ncbi:hypothetical protein GG804_07640 [Sphingomonas histidinilytica]|jgi:uncharacterized OB-fold protein|uniref:Uncharacterized OB-fold protein, contains Zn-ribbon domain n=1 Tax=Rhizorhabdus histidinilytica TaxID=439228 RepID=A0A1T5ES41_9SPHN|nr:OB-fold domain-containing protein [Rhizorhabdus histidinilytica]MBO9376634.1 hypothetical protein [Rhizorhabdus histidinilytica]QEH76914.1 hypothetical protein EIK56_01555 [Sphingomonas sp. C8-2]SKB86638.1 Uncharacterized OB-fold protein, contains Zn-ribbon domain [Rhizorhabdus histidinilytica]
MSAEIQALKPVMPYLGQADDGTPYLIGSRCDACGQTHLGRFENCPRCTARGKLTEIHLSEKGVLYNYTIVYRSLPGVTVPFISAVVDLDGGGTVKGNLLDVDPSPEAIRFGMPVKMVFREADTAVAGGEGYVSHFFVPAN